MLATVADGTELVVFPEATMHDFGAADHDLAAIAEPLDGPFVTMLCDAARRLSATIIAGMFESTDTVPFNTLVVAGPDGHLQSVYRKVHLYDSFGYRESDRLAAGDITPVTIAVNGHTLGLMTCYDLRFPEFARALIDAGAEAFVIPAAWVAGPLKQDHWVTLCRARAIENTAAVVAAAQGGDRYSGHSLATDAMGQILAEAASEAELLTVDIDFDEVAQARTTNPSLANRRMQ